MVFTDLFGTTFQLMFWSTMISIIFYNGNEGIEEILCWWGCCQHSSKTNEKITNICISADSKAHKMINDFIKCSTCFIKYLNNVFYV